MTKRIAANACWISLLAASCAAAQTITGVMNAASRIAQGLPNSAIARGAVFVVTGTGIGPDERQQASGFPLPVWDGVGGTTVLITVGDNTVPAVMLYSSSTEVGAIMPSNAPTGSATLTLRYNDQIATAPVTVVDAAFGIFTQDHSGRGAAIAQNTADGSDPVMNSVSRPLRPGQNVLLHGTGAGPIASDETQSGITDAVATNLQVWVGNKPATVVSAARGNCCGATDPGFPFPQGVAGWDVIQFTIPDGVSGCHVPVAVQAGDLVSNFATLAIAPVDQACADPGGMSASDLEPFAGAPVRMGIVNLSRNSIKVNIPGMSMEMNSDSGSASFLRFEPAALDTSANPFTVASVGACTVLTGNHNLADLQSAFPAATVLDAGSAINITGNGITRKMEKNAGGTYIGNFGSGTSLPFSLPGAQAPFLEPGTFTADNGAGGADVGAFSASLVVPKGLSWSNQDQIDIVDRSQGVTVTWTGGDPASFVTIMGLSANKDLAGLFLCTEQASAGQFTVPSMVTASLPPSTTESSGGLEVPTGIMYVGSSATGKFTSPDLDLGYFISTVAAMKNLTFK